MENNYFEILEEIYDSISFLAAIVDKYGQVKGLSIDEESEEFYDAVHHDYVYFCFTKMLRSSLAYCELSKMGFREDCFVIGRSIYETYLHVSNALNNKTFIDIAVFQSLKVKSGIYLYATYKSGVKNPYLVYDPKTKEYFQHDLGTKALLKGSLCNKIDKKLHYMFYNFMSELIHSNFIGSGNYRCDNHTRYNVEPNLPHLDIIFTLAYLVFLLCEHMEYYHVFFDAFDDTELYAKDIVEFSIIRGLLIQRLEEMISLIEFSNKEKKMKQFLQKRIKADLIKNRLDK